MKQLLILLLASALFLFFSVAISAVEQTSATPTNAITIDTASWAPPGTQTLNLMTDQTMPMRAERGSPDSFAYKNNTMADQSGGKSGTVTTNIDRDLANDPGGTNFAASKSEKNLAQNSNIENNYTDGTRNTELNVNGRKAGTEPIIVCNDETGGQTVILGKIYVDEPAIVYLGDLCDNQFVTSAAHNKTQHRLV